MFYCVLPPRSLKGCHAEFLSLGDLPLALAGCAACELVRSSCREAFAKKARAMTAPDVLDAWYLSLMSDPVMLGDIFDGMEQSVHKV